MFLGFFSQYAQHNGNPKTNLSTEPPRIRPESRPKPPRDSPPNQTNPPLPGKYTPAGIAKGDQGKSPGTTLPSRARGIYISAALVAQTYERVPAPSLNSLQSCMLPGRRPRICRQRRIRNRTDGCLAKKASRGRRGGMHRAAASVMVHCTGD
jgi:hypothetical protein